MKRSVIFDIKVLMAIYVVLISCQIKLKQWWTISKPVMVQLLVICLIILLLRMSAAYFYSLRCEESNSKWKQNKCTEIAIEVYF